MLKNFDELLKRLDTQDKKKIVVAMAEDSDVLLSLEKARSDGLAEAVQSCDIEPSAENL